MICECEDVVEISDCIDLLRRDVCVSRNGLDFSSEWCKCSSGWRGRTNRSSRFYMFHKQTSCMLMTQTHTHGVHPQLSASCRDAHRQLRSYRGRPACRSDRRRSSRCRSSGWRRWPDTAGPETSALQSDRHTDTETELVQESRQTITHNINNMLRVPQKLDFGLGFELLHLDLRKSAEQTTDWITVRTCSV